MKSKFILSIFLLLFTTFAVGQDSAQLKRAAFKLTVAVDKKTVYEEDIKASPYVLPNKAVQIYPGESIYLEIEHENGAIKTVTAVEKITNPEKTLTISFTQTSNKKIHELMMLKIENPFDRDISYKSMIFLLKQNRWVATDVYPVRARLAAFETWPDIITSIALGNWEFKNPKD